LPARISTGESSAPWQGTHTNCVERALRPVALSRKNALFAGSDEGGANWAATASLVETCKLNSIDP
jgi:transposase